MKQVSFVKTCIKHEGLTSRKTLYAPVSGNKKEHISIEATHTHTWFVVTMTGNRQPSAVIASGQHPLFKLCK